MLRAGTVLLALLGAFALLCAVCGCKAQNVYTEGTNLMLGLYVPTTEGLVGLQVVDYLSGVKVATQTNMPFCVEREFCSSNSYFGVVETFERVNTKVVTGLQK